MGYGYYDFVAVEAKQKQVRRFREEFSVDREILEKEGAASHEQELRGLASQRPRDQTNIDPTVAFELLRLRDGRFGVTEVLAFLASDEIEDLVLEAQRRTQNSYVLFHLIKL